MQISSDLQWTARRAGILYLFSGALIGYGIMHVPGQEAISRNWAETGQDMLQNEFTYRTRIVAHLAGSLIFVLLALNLYGLFKTVNKNTSRFLFAVMIIQVPIVFVLEAFRLTALILLKADSPNIIVHEGGSVPASLLHAYHSGLMLLSIFFGVWLLPFGKLVYQSGFMPRILGILLTLAGVGYILSAAVYLLLPSLHPFTKWIALALSGVAEASTIAWLLVKGAKVNRQPGSGAASPI